MKTQDTVNSSQEWFVYLIECGDKSWYCGIATDVNARLAAHNAGKGAKYTRGRGPLALVWRSTKALSHGDALRLERKIKRMTRVQKEKFIGAKQKE
jgi:putative endonuclease